MTATTQIGAQNLKHVLKKTYFGSGGTCLSNIWHTSGSSYDRRISLGRIWALGPLASIIQEIKAQVFEAASRARAAAIDDAVPVQQRANGVCRRSASAGLAAIDSLKLAREGLNRRYSTSPAQP